MRKLMMAMLGAMLLAVGTFVAYAAISNPAQDNKATVEAVSNEQGTVGEKSDCSYSKSAAYSKEECESRKEAWGDCSEKKARSGCDWEKKQQKAETGEEASLE